jgi:hypothetical protein
LALLIGTTALNAQSLPDYSPAPALSFFGLPGLMDMPVARSLPDAELAATAMYFSNMQRNTLSFQVTQRVTGSFRYSIHKGGLADGGTNFDRGIDLHYRFIDEGRLLPAVAIGVRDFGGTGRYASEYLVATKSLGQKLEVSGGIGWGRLGSHGSFANPLGGISSYFDTRPPRPAEGGTFNLDQWFRGPAALFAGVQWQATDRLTLKAEYSSDAYAVESGRNLMNYRSPFNFGAQYQIRPGIVLGAYYLYGAEVGVSASFTLNPKRPPNGGDIGAAPPPVIVRNGAAASWGADSVISTTQDARLRTDLANALAAEGIVLESMRIDGGTARMQVRNTRFDAVPQALGRISRILTRYLPPAVEMFEIVPVVEGMRAARVTLRRSDMEALEHDPNGARLSYARAVISDAGTPLFTDEIAGGYPRLSWGLGPYVATALFDPGNPFRVDVGLDATLRYDIAPGLVLSGAVRLKAFGNRDQSTRPSTSVLPHVRSDSNIYDQEGASGLEYLTVEYFARPGRNLYSRVSVGYLEAMYGGASAELLWKPVDSRLALGAEINYARQRDFNKQFGFQSYGIVTGHASAYYDFANGFEGTLDVGRYLAGDWGATMRLDRTFDNGWKLGAFATVTDVSASDFGEGSFDKGIQLTVPLSWFSGHPTQRGSDAIIRPVLRDGGARLNVRNRLNGLVSEYHDPALQGQWGRFWR